ncbi:hypothetical protein ACFVXH_39525 [Kitasatospora sp. NPDC058184]|uniref:hypothetical protein n=1 Tax=Kitasatospora sp. NPDC058184 TaxID=3346370 RepID=UPI0036DAEB20
MNEPIAGPPEAHAHVPGPFAEYEQDLEILADDGAGTHAWPVHYLAGGGRADVALDLVLAERDSAVPAGEAPGGPGFAQALRAIAADVARHRAGLYEEPEWWRDYDGARLGLDSLSRDAVCSPKASAMLARFAHEESRAHAVVFDSWVDADIEIEGARIFGCLLHLAGHPVSAAFWWRIAAGAGDQRAAFALYLQHLGAGELDEAQWWLAQACQAADGHGAAPGLPPMPGYYRTLPTVMGPWRTAENSKPAASLAREVGRLVEDNDEAGADIDGIARRPGPGLASRLEELAGHR